MFADDTEWYKSTDRSSISCLLTAMQSWVSDVKDWSLVNKLQLNEDKTEALLLDPSQSANPPASLQTGQTCVTLLILLVILASFLTAIYL